MHLPFAVSTSLRFFFVPSTLSSDPAIHAYLCDMAVTPPPRSYTHPRRFTTALSTYPENSTRLIFSRTSHPVPLLSARPNHIYPLRILNPNNTALQGKISLPFLVVFQEVFLWLGPIDRVCVLLTSHRCCITGDSSQTCTIFFVHPRLSSPYLKASIPRRDSCLDILLLYQMDDISLHAVSR